MILSVLIVFIILYIYLKYPHVFDFKNKYISGRYIRLERDSGTDPINFANFIIYDEEHNIITPLTLSVNPQLSFGDGKTPKAKSIMDLTDIVLIETTSGTSDNPYIEYDLGQVKKISNIFIINRKKFNQRMQKTIIRILDEDRNQVFEKKITELQDIYSINVS